MALEIPDHCGRLEPTQSCAQQACTPPGDLDLGHGVGESTIWVSVTESSVSVWKSGVGEDGSGSGFLSGLFISRSLTAGLSLSEARNCESKHVGAAGLLDGVGHV